MTDGDLTVLCVDDDTDLLALTADVLEREADDIAVVTETNAGDALDRIAETAVDCVVSDYQMPGANGVEFLESVRETHPDLPFVLFTGKGSEEVAAAAIEADVTSYLRKSTGTDQYSLLANRIRNHVEQFRSKRRADRLEEEYRLVARTASDAFWSADLTTDEVRMHGLSNFGYDDADVDRDWWLDRVHPDDRGQVFAPADDVPARDEAAFDELEGNRGWYSTEFRWRRGDGTYADCTERGVVLFDGDEATRMHGTMTDVTDRRRREETLRSLHEATRSFMDAADHRTVAERAVSTAGSVLDLPLCGCWLYDDGDDVLRPVALSDAAADLVGEAPVYRGDDSLSWRAFESGEVAVHDDLQRASGLVNPDTSIRSELVLPLGEHGVINVGSTAARGFDDVDVTLARILAKTVEAAMGRADREQELRQRQADFERMRERTEFAMASTETVVWEIDLRTGETTSHGPSEALFGVETDALDEFLPRVVHPDDRETVRSVVGAVRTGERDAFEVEFRTHPDHGDVRWISSDGFVRAGRDGEPRQLTGLATDVTDRKRRQRTLRRQNERLEEFAAIVGHDLRNPITTAKTRLELVRDDRDETGDRDEESDRTRRNDGDDDHLAAVQRSLERIEDVVEDTLVLARQGRTTAAVEEVEPGRIAERSWRTVGPETATLRVDDVPAVRADPGRLRHVFENLFRNAVVHAGADVAVRVGELDDGDGLFVEDDGPGIPADERTAVFEPGYTTADEGSGFGLRIVEAIVEAHGWEIAVTDGEGSRDGPVEADGGSGGARFEIRDVEYAA